MSLWIDDFEIRSRYLRNVITDIDQRLLFTGIALEEKGKAICEQQSKFEKGHIVEVEALTDRGDIVEGIFEIIEITIPPPDVSKAPAIFRFSGILKRVQ